MLKKIFALTLAMAASAAVAGAQRNSRGSNPIEFGIDGGITIGLESPTVTILSLPAQDFRMGFILNNTWEAEPRFGLTSIHSNGNSLTTYQLALGVLWHPGANPTGKGIYVRPFLGIAGTSVSGGGSNSNGILGIGLGAKLPFADRRLATRLEVNFANALGDGGGNQLGLLFGLSFFH
jgi:hypothetical protein